MSIRFFIHIILASALLLLSLAAHSQQTDSNSYIDPNQAKIDSLQNLIRPGTPDSVKAWLYSRIANVTCHSDTCLKYARLSLDLYKSKQPDRDSLLAYNYNNIANVYYMRDESRKALQYRFLSANIYNNLSDKLREAGTYIHIGNCYLDLNVKDSIFYYYNKAIIGLTEINDTAFIIDAYNNLGQIYDYMALYSNAEKNYRKALEFAKASGSSPKTARCLCYVGSSMMAQSDSLIDDAIEYLNKSINLFEEIASPKHYDIEEMHIAYMTIAKTYIKKAEITGRGIYADSCYIFAQKADKYFLSVGTYTNYVDCRYCYVEYLIFNKRYNEALAELLNLKKYLTDDRVAAYQIYYNNLYEVYAHLGDYKNALLYHEKYMNCSMQMLNDSTFNTIKDAELERTHQLDSISHHYETLRLEAEHQQQLRERQEQLWGILAIAVILAISAISYFHYFRLRKDNERNKLRLHAIEIERALLRTQMNPHFIFNALNSIQSFIAINNAKDASIFLSKFAKLMRLILNNSLNRFVLLSDELISLRLYLDLEQARFSNKFNYEINVDDDVEEDLISVPPMLIQPFVENAIIHGLMHKPEGGQIIIDITDNGNHTLTCIITDNGVGRKAAAELEKNNNKTHKSVGMQLTRRRLQELNSNAQIELSCIITDLTDDQGNATGTQVTIIIPEQDYYGQNASSDEQHQQ